MQIKRGSAHRIRFSSKNENGGPCEASIAGGGGGSAEMICQSLLGKTSRRMGHISMAGSGGSISAFSSLGVGRKIYVHINSSNPVLDAGSKERSAVEAAGWEIGYDGMEVRL